MNQAHAPCIKNAKQVTLLPCDDGIKFVFISGKDESVAATVDWVTAADMALRLDQLGAEALTMMQIGLSPYKLAHRQSFTEAAFGAPTTPSGGA